MNRIVSFLKGKVFVIGFFLIVFCAFYHSVIAQEPVVPFRSGKLWGLMKPDKTVFYPAVFDTIFLHIDTSHYSQILAQYYPYDSRLVIHVVHNGKTKFLSDKKELIDSSNYFETFRPYHYSIPRTTLPLWPSDIEAKPAYSDSVKWYNPKTAFKKKPRSVFSTDLKNKASVFTFRGSKQVTDSVYVYDLYGRFYFTYNDSLIPELTCSALHSPQYFYQYQWKPRDIFVAKKGKKYGVLSFIKNKVVVPFEYDTIYNTTSNEALFVVQKNGLWGLFGDWGQQLTDLQYKVMVPYKTREGIFMVNSGDRRYSFLEYRGYSFLENHLENKVDTIHGNYEKIESTYEWPDMFGGTDLKMIFKTRENGKYGLLLSSDWSNVTSDFDEITAFSYGRGKNRFFRLRSGEKYGLFDIQTKNKIEPKYRFISAPILFNHFYDDAAYTIFFVEDFEGRGFFVDNYGVEFIVK